MSDKKTFQVCPKICKICNKYAKYVSQNLICRICTPHFADDRDPPESVTRPRECFGKGVISKTQINSRTIPELQPTNPIASDLTLELDHY
jgi:hypothetical protein